jgi:hypothetical protein
MKPPRLTSVRHRFGRRRFVKGVGLAGLAGPFLRVLRGEAATPPKRLVVMSSSNGTVMSELWPGPGFTFGAILKPVEALKPKITVMRGIDIATAYKRPIPQDHRPDNHNMLTARQPVGDRAAPMAGISVDQHIANAIGQQTKFASLQLGTQVGVDRRGAPVNYISSRGPGQGLFPENSPYKAFDRLFQDVAAPGSGDPAALERLRAQRRSMLDVVRAELGELRCALGAAERPKLDAHLEALRELERNRAATGGSGARCEPPAAPTPATLDNTKIPEIGKLHMDLIVAALACDLTRIVTLQWGSGSSELRHPWAGPAAEHHTIAHNLAGSAEQCRGWTIQIETWHAQQFAYLASKLDALPTTSGGGTVLDSTALLWCHEQSNGANHSRRDMPYVLAGSCNGAFKTGRAVEFGGRAHNGLLISLANAMDVPTTTFGDPEFSAGPLPDL